MWCDVGWTRPTRWSNLDHQLWEPTSATKGRVLHSTCIQYVPLSLGSHPLTDQCQPAWTAVLYCKWLKSQFEFWPSINRLYHPFSWSIHLYACYVKPPSIAKLQTGYITFLTFSAEITPNDHHTQVAFVQQRRCARQRGQVQFLQRQWLPHYHDQTGLNK